MYRQLGEVTDDNKKASRIKTIIHPELHTEPPMLLLASTSCVIRDLTKSCFTNYAKPAVEHDPHSLQTVSDLSCMLCNFFILNLMEISFSQIDLHRNYFYIRTQARTSTLMAPYVHYRVSA
jgi:hypothetical protein